jgi:L-lysine exporter family protein LysE/ArgO
MGQAVLAGLALGGSLIVAIGAQNAFVIRQGVLNRHVFWICLFCAFSDAVLIWGGTYGLAALLALVPQLLLIMRYGGAVFLLWYGFKAAQRALHPQAMMESDAASQTLGSALALCAAFTWLNPHVYLDTVVLVGSVANARPAGEQASFAAGASLASFLWFFAIGYGAKALRGPLSRPQVWRAIDVVIALVMLWLAVKLVFGG